MQRIFKLLKELNGKDAEPAELLQIPLNIEDIRVQSTIIEILKEAYNNKMPFNKLLGIDVEEISMNIVKIKIEMRDDLVGNYEQKILHGGVISAVLDLTGGIIAQINAIPQLNGETAAVFASRFSKMSTTNIRVDYLNPGYGDYFFSTGTIAKIGNKIATSQMEFRNDKNKLIAIATGSYLVG